MGPGRNQLASGERQQGEATSANLEKEFVFGDTIDELLMVELASSEEHEGFTECPCQKGVECPQVLYRISSLWLT